MDSILANMLKPLSGYYADNTVVELHMTRPEQVIIDKRGTPKSLFYDEVLTRGAIETICKSLSNKLGLDFDEDTKPQLSCTIPSEGHRFECLVGPSVQSGLSLTMRLKHPFHPRWDEVGANEAVISYLYDAIMDSKNLIVSGATNTGKTTLLNMLLEIIPENRRVIAVEDTPELTMGRFYDGVGLLAARESGSGPARQTNAGMVSWREIYDHCMRSTPDNIIFGEISTQNAFAALGALNSGITGFMCTLHAESPHQALHRKFSQNIAWSGQTMPDVGNYLMDLIDVVVQIKRSDDGVRRISDIYEPRRDVYVMKDGVFEGNNTSKTPTGIAA